MVADVHKRLRGTRHDGRYATRWCVSVIAAVGQRCMSRRSACAPMAAVFAAVVHGVCATGVAWQSSPNLDEPAHLAAGISCWTHARFDLYRVNPPLVRAIAAVPVLLFCRPEVDWSSWNSASPANRSEFQVGFDFARANGGEVWAMFRAARVPGIVLASVTGWLCYRWAAEIYGRASAVLSIWIWALCPTFLTWDASITTDSAAATSCLAASYLFWKWRVSPTYSGATLCGFALGVALAAKFTSLLLLAVWPLLLLVPVGRGQRKGRSCAQGAVIIILALHIVNMVYLYDGSFKRLGDIRCVSRILTSDDERAPNRLSATPLGWLRVPVPEEFVKGLDVQQRDFENKKWSYLRGEQRLGGWIHWYVYAWFVKTPVGTILLAGLALWTAVVGWPTRATANEIFVLFPMVVILIAVSMQTGFSRHMRYILPAMPFLYIAIGRVVSPGAPMAMRVIVPLLTVASAVESVAVWPCSASFFNIVAGGPSAGGRHLLDSNLDWGQDALRLRKWCLEHPDASPLKVAYFGGIELTDEMLGIEAS